MVSVVLQIHYYAPAGVDGDLIGHGKVIHRGGKLMGTEAEVFDRSGHLIAKGTSVLRILRPAI